MSSPASLTIAVAVTLLLASGASPVVTHRASPDSAPHAPQVDTGAIARAVLEDLARERVKRPITLDPRLPGQNGPLAMPRNSHSPTTLAGAAVPGQVLVATAEEAQRCNTSGPVCKTNGFGDWAILYPPVIRGDTATTRVFMRSVRDLTATDSAQVRANHIRREQEMKDPAYRGPPMNIFDSTRTFERMSRGGATMWECVSVRAGASWRLLTARIVGQS